MKRHLLVIASLLVATTAGLGADRSAKLDADAAFARLKTLVGEWEGNTSMGKVRVTYDLVAGGTALVERESGEKMPAMLTVYHVDKGRLLLTHYCIAGNQPRMQAQAFNAETGELDFRFLDATNLASANVGHMHNAKIRVVDNNNMTSEWQFHENGRQKFAENSQYTRIR